MTDVNFPNLRTLGELLLADKEVNIKDRSDIEDILNLKIINMPAAVKLYEILFSNRFRIPKEKKKLLKKPTVFDPNVELAKLYFRPKHEIITQKTIDTEVVCAPCTPRFMQMWTKHRNEFKAFGIFLIKSGTKEWTVCKPVEVAEKIGEAQIWEKFSNPPDVALKNEIAYYDAKLLEYQRPHTRQIIKVLSRHQGCLDGSDTGTGKTYSAIAAAYSMGLVPFVVCPKHAFGAWLDAADWFKKKVVLYNYEALRTGGTEFVKKTFDEKVFRWHLPANYLIVFDEAHRTKNRKTLNSQLLISTKYTNNKVLMMSATIAEYPLKLYAVALVLNLFKPGKYNAWLELIGYKRGPIERPLGNIRKLDTLNKAIYPEHGSRMRKSELKGLFPELSIVVDRMLFDYEDEIAKLQVEMEVEIKKIQDKEMKDVDHPLVRLLRMRQRMEMLKVPTIVDMAQDLVEEGNSVVIFVNYTDTVVAIANKLKTTCLIYGGIKDAEQDKNEADFQADKERIIVCNLQCGGESRSFHDIHGTYPRIELLVPSWSAQQFKQAIGRIHRAKGKSPAIVYVLLANTAIDNRIKKNIAKKLDNIDTLNDGDLGKPEGIPLV